MSGNDLFNYDENSASQGSSRVRWVVGGVVAAVCVLLVMFWGFLFKKSEAPAPKKETVMIRPLPPPPPVKTPPPPKAEPEKIREEMVEQAPVDDSEEKPADETPADPGLSTGLTGTGGPDYGLSKAGTGNRIGGSGKKSGSKFGWYAAQVQRRISDAIREHPVARVGEGTIRVRIWADSTGRVTKARLLDKTGNQKLDTALGDQLLPGLMLSEPPPSDMPQPITLRISLKRNN